MKILFVCQQYIHSARWINQLKDSRHEIYVFDCLDRPVHQDLKWTNYFGNWGERKLPYIKGEHFLKKRFPRLYKALEPFLRVTPSEKLSTIIREVQPDLIHSLEMQSQTYEVWKVRKRFKFKWAYFCWGNDLFAYESKRTDKKTIQSVMKHIDFLFADTYRDIKLSKSKGYAKPFSEVFPGGGGYHIKSYQPYIQPIEERNLIMIKGYQHNYGRALFVLAALEFIIDEIKDHQVYVYSAHKTVIQRIEELNSSYGLSIQYTPRTKELSHKELLEKFGSAQIAIGNNISDGIPNTLLEAMICGAFPIQSNPGGATEDYLVDGVNGLLIQNPEDAKEIADKIKRSIEDQELRQKAFIINQEKAKKLDYKSIQTKVLEAYDKIEKSI